MLMSDIIFRVDQIFFFFFKCLETIIAEDALMQAMDETAVMATASDHDSFRLSFNAIAAALGFTTSLNGTILQGSCR